MPKHWSKLQREIYKLIDSRIGIQIHCSVYRMDSRWGGTDLPRYWITLGKEIIFDYPKDFLDKKLPERGLIISCSHNETVEELYPNRDKPDIGYHQGVYRHAASGSAIP